MEIPMIDTRETVVRQLYKEQFAVSAEQVVRAPGRVNIIGEHTDYNDGFVLPMAIDRAVWVAVRPRSDHVICLYSAEFKEMRELDLTAPRAPDAETGWFAYVQGVVLQLQQAGYPLQGWDGVLCSDVPVGAGLSSSAALELAVARACNAVSGFEWKAIEMATLCQRAEKEWVGVKCGVMDQMISAVGVAGHAMLIDCRSLSVEAVPLPSGTTMVIMDTGSRRGLVDSAYNERRSQCQEAARFLGVPALRDCTMDVFQTKRAELDALVARRAGFVIAENERTQAAAAAMRAGDPLRLGVLMNESHAGLRDDFEVSSPALNRMVELAQVERVCYGARMTGAGFGGCAVALVESTQADAFSASVSRYYRQSTGLEARLYVTGASGGAS